MQRAEQNDVNLGLANSRVPPGWSVEGDKKYPLRDFIQDINLWSAATDMEEARKGPAVALRITGSARIIIREMPIELLRDGQMVFDAVGNPVQDPNNPARQLRRTGLQCLVRALQGRYGALDQEVQVHAVSELMTFSRLSSESADESIARFDVILYKAQQAAGMAVPPVIRAWLILTILRIPRAQWALVLAPFAGMLPADEQQYSEMISYVRRNQHLFENQGDKQKSLQHPYFAQDSYAPASENAFSTFHEGFHHAGSANSNAYANTAWDYGGNTDDTVSWHSWSTGHSEPGVDDLTWDDIVGMTGPEANEYLYLNYQFAKRRFRKIGFKRKRFYGKRFGKGKSKGQNKFGKGHFPAFSDFTIPDRQYALGNSADSYPSFPESETPSHELCFAFKGGGKGNPMGKDGRPMTCSQCGSTEHFWRQCPSKGKGKGKGGNGPAPSTFHSSTSYPSYPTQNSLFGATSQTSSVAASSSGPSQKGVGPFSFYCGTTNMANDVHATLKYRDGTSQSLEVPQAFAATEYDPITASLTPARHTLLKMFAEDKFYPIWDAAGMAFHTQVKLLRGEALLVDTGAVGNLAGSVWVDRAAHIAQAAGQGTHVEPIKGRPQSIGGVGQGDSSVTHEASVPLAFEDGDTGVFETRVVGESELPALLGVETMIRRRVVLDLINMRYYEIGPAGLHISLPPGSRSLAIHRAPTGHLLLPISEWMKVQNGARTLKTPQVYTVERGQHE